MVIEVPISYQIIGAENKINGIEGSDLHLFSVAELPSRYGNFLLLGFDGFLDGKPHVVVVKGDIVGKKNVLVRVHSECLTSEVLGSLRCDCQSQLEQSFQRIENEGEGIIIYLRQEGRGIGLLNKIRAYELQDKGMNTMEANRALGFQDDLRKFDAAVEVLKFLNIKSIRLLTNNPFKINKLQDGGITLVERVALWGEVNKHNEDYLRTKQKIAEHMLDL